jgi:cytochrome d ubiquinol oxidase subunit I
LGVLAGSALSFLAMELGWMVTELGRQPWILYHIMTVQQAVTSSPYVGWLFYGLLSFFILASALTIYILTSYFRVHPLPMLVTSDEAGDAAPVPQLAGGACTADIPVGSGGVAEREVAIHG